MTNVLYILGLLLAFGIVGNMDYAEEMRQEAERQAAAAQGGLMKAPAAFRRSA